MALKGFVGDLIAIHCTNDGIENAVQGPKVIKMVTKRVVMSEKLTRSIKGFVKGQVSKTFRDITGMNLKNFGVRQSSPSYGPPCDHRMEV